jgi:hypothetical protein
VIYLTVELNGRGEENKRMGERETVMKEGRKISKEKN